NAQGTGTGCTDLSNCPGSAFNAITAALATEGYYQQSQFLYYLTQTGLSQIAGLIYILAGAAGIMAMVLGSPPRNYVWFFIGPAIYNWLVLTPDYATGVRWYTGMGDAGVSGIADNGKDAANQKKVALLAFPVLANS